MIFHTVLFLRKTAFRLAICISFLLSCRQAESDKTEITFWAMGAEGEKIGKLVPKFEEKHPVVYLYRIETESFSQVRKMTLVR